MKNNLQQKLITEYLWDVICTDDNNPYENIDVLSDYISKKIRRMDAGDLIAVDLEDTFSPIKLVDAYSDLSTISKDAVLIPYKMLESKFYEQIQREFYG